MPKLRVERALVGSGPGFQPHRCRRRDPGRAGSVGRLESWRPLAPKPSPDRAVCRYRCFLCANCARQGRSTVSPAQSRYVYVAMALLLPVIAKLLSPTGQSTRRVLGRGGAPLFHRAGQCGASPELGELSRHLHLRTEKKCASRRTIARFWRPGRLRAGAAPINFDPNLSAVRWATCSAPVGSLTLLSARSNSSTRAPCSLSEIGTARLLP